MQASRVFDTIDTHTAGEPTRIITTQLDWSADPRNVRDRRDAFAAEHDGIRQLAMREPRGHAGMFGAVPVPADSPTADLGIFFMDAKGYLDMCGHGTIGVVTSFIETGRLEPKEVVRIETPAGLVEARPTVEDGAVTSVTVRNVDSYVLGSAEIPVEGVGDVAVDLVYSGNLFALVDVDQFDVEVTTDETPTLVEYGMRIRAAANEHVEAFGGDPEEDEVMLTELYERGDDVDRNITVFGDRQVDRSPCGTGTCAKMTLLHSKGRLERDEPYPHESVIGSRFTGRIRAVEERDGRTVVSPEITGSAYVIGKHTYFRDPDDPLDGFLV